jgi:hypothetical protein
VPAHPTSRATKDASGRSTFPLERSILNALPPASVARGQATAHPRLCSRLRRALPVVQANSQCSYPLLLAA